MDMNILKSEYSHLIVNLFGVIALLFALLYILKKVKTAKHASNKHIKIINTVAIGAKERIILIEVNNTTLLVGATPTHIETLHVFKEMQAADYMDSEYLDPTNTFAHQLAAMK